MTQPSLFDAPRRVRPVPPIVREKARRESNATRVLARLQQGPATTMELIAVGGARAAARAWELKQQGYAITVTDLGGGLFRYALEGR